MKPIISVEGLGKSYTIRHEGRTGYKSLREEIFKLPERLLHPNAQSQEEFWALKDVSFDVMPGDRVGIIGRNGAGKSTLLKLLSRITEPTTGRITLRGRVASLLEVGTGFHPELSGRENIFLNGAILGMSRAEVRKKFDEIVDFAGVEKFLDTPVKRYSSGMYVRLAFAVAAHLEPEILIVDEVLAVGDAEFQKKCLGKMEDVGKEGRTVLFVSHNLLTVIQLCNKSYLIENGKIAYSGEARNTVEFYTNGQSKNKQARWVAPDRHQHSPYYLPTTIELVDNNQHVIDGPTPADTHLFLKIDGVCTEYDARLQLGFALVSEDNNVILWSFHTDGFDNTSWPQISMGKNTFFVELPHGLLNTGKYKIQFLSAIYSTKWLYSPKESSIEIEFELTPPEKQSHYITGGRAGLLAPVLTWHKG